MAFPTSPATGAQYTINGQTYEYNGAAWNIVGGTGLATNILEISGNTTVSAKDYVICETSGATLSAGQTAYTVTLPASPEDKDVIKIMDGDSNAQNRPILVARNGNNIDGAAGDLTCDIDFFNITLIYDTGTTNWRIGK